MNKERLDKIKDLKITQKEKLKAKKPDKFTAKEKDELLLTMARMMNLID